MRSSVYIQPSWVLKTHRNLQDLNDSLRYISESPTEQLSDSSTCSISPRDDATVDRLAEGKVVEYGVYHFWFNIGPDQALDCHFFGFVLPRALIRRRRDFLASSCRRHECSVSSLIAVTRPYNAWRYQREVKLEETDLVAVGSFRCGDTATRNSMDIVHIRGFMSPSFGIGLK